MARDLEVDFGENPETWVNRLWEPGLSGPEINLGVRTGKRSRLMVLEVAKGPGEAILDQYGPWRAECIAVLGAGRERHFYAWHPSPLFDSASFRGTLKSGGSGKGRWCRCRRPLILKCRKPGSGCALLGTASPNAPASLCPGFLQQHLTREPQLRPEVSFSWQEVYCLISSHEPLLQALAATYPSMQDYYLGILEAAAAVGLKAPEVLLSVLWHAPRGNARQHPEILDYLQKLVAAAQAQPGAATCPEPVPWELTLDNALSQARETSAGSSGLARRINRGRRVSSRDVWLNRLNPGGLFGPPFPVARSGDICRKSNAA